MTIALGLVSSTGECSLILRGVGRTASMISLDVDPKHAAVVFDYVTLINDRPHFFKRSPIPLVEGREGLHTNLGTLLWIYQNLRHEDLRTNFLERAKLVRNLAVLQSLSGVSDIVSGADGTLNAFDRVRLEKESLRLSRSLTPHDLYRFVAGEK